MLPKKLEEKIIDEIIEEKVKKYIMNRNLDNRQLSVMRIIIEGFDNAFFFGRQTSMTYEEFMEAVKITLRIIAEIHMDLDREELR